MNPEHQKLNLQHRLDPERQGQGGFSLLETILIVALSAVVVLGGTQLVMDFADRARQRIAANQLMSVHEAAKTYITSNFIQIYCEFGAQSTSPTIYPNSVAGVTTCTDDINNGATTLFDTDGDNIDDPVNNFAIQISVSGGAGTFNLTDGSVFEPQDVPDSNTYGQDFTIAVRHLGEVLISSPSGANTQSNRRLSILTYAHSGGAIAEDTLRGMNRFIGPEAGAIQTSTLPDFTASPAGIRSVFGEWDLPVTDYVASTAEGGGTLLPTIPPAGEGGYPAAYARVSYGDGFCEDCMHRIAIPGREELNRMESNLLMNGNDVSNIRTMSAENVATNGLDVQNGGQGLRVEQALQVEDATQIGSGLADPAADGSDLTISGIDSGGGIAPRLEVNATASNVDVFSVGQSAGGAGELSVTGTTGNDVSVTGDASFSNPTGPDEEITMTGTAQFRGGEVVTRTMTLDDSADDAFQTNDLQVRNGTLNTRADFERLGVPRGGRINLGGGGRLNTNDLTSSGGILIEGNATISGKTVARDHDVRGNLVQCDSPHVTGNCLP